MFWDKIGCFFKAKRRKYQILGMFIVLMLVGGSWLLVRVDSAVGERMTLYWGSSGSEVHLLQSRLSEWGYYQGAIDGVYGAKTAQAVRDFQRKNGLTVDGVVGPSTWAGLGYPTVSGVRTVAVSSRGVSQGDNVELLARIINGEARGEPYIGQVAVGAVVLNRVRDSRYPNSIAGVIYQPGAFTAVSDGQINAPSTESARRAALDALNGWDPSYGAVFYYNPAKTTNAWIWSRPRIITIGKHIVCR